MIHYFCPFCWTEVSEGENDCPHCDRNMKEWDEKATQRNS